MARDGIKLVLILVLVTILLLKIDILTFFGFNVYIRIACKVVFFLVVLVVAAFL